MRQFKLPEPTDWNRLDELLEAYSLYQRHPEWWNPRPMERERYELVCRYLDYSSEPAYRYVLKGGLQGVSLIYHEAEELDWYFKKPLNPFGRIRRQRKNPKGEWQNYLQAHALGLIAEHHFLKERAQAEGHSFQIGELIRWNPVSAHQVFDFRTVRKYVRENGETRVSANELTVRAAKKQAVIDWYRSQGFEGRFPRDLS